MNDSVLNRRALGAGAVIAALALGIGALAAGSAGAAGAKIATEIVVFDGGSVDGDFIVFGRLTSKRKKCKGNRELILRTKRSGKFTTADRGRSSSNGGWTLLTKEAGPEITAVAVKAKRKKLRSGAVCRGATWSYTFGGQMRGAG